MTPEDLLRRIARGDEKALGALYDACGGLVYSLARRVTGSDREAEEITQDVFVAAWRNAGQFDPGRANAATWLTALTRNKAIDRLRATRRRLPAAPAEADEWPEPADPAPGPAETIARDDRTKHIRLWIGELPPNQREAVELAFFEGLTHPEIAARLNATIGTVKSRIRLGLDRLRHKLKGGLE